MKKCLFAIVILMICLSGCTDSENIETSNSNTYNDPDKNTKNDEQETPSANIDTTAEVTTAEPTTAEPTTETTTSIAQLNQLINSQPVYVQDTKYIDRSSLRAEEAYFKKYYCDYISPIIKNNSGKDIKDIKIGYAAWDANNLPLKVEGYYDCSNIETNDEFISTNTLHSVNIPIGGTYKYTFKDGKDSIFYGDDDCPFLIDHNSTTTIAKCKAFVISYIDFDGNTWENPYYDEWRAAYEGKKLSE